MAKILPFYRHGAPETLLANATDLALDMKFVIMVFVSKDGSISTEWSKLDSNLEGLGAVEVLKHALADEALDG